MSNLSIRAPLAWLGTGGLTPDVQIDLDGGVIASVGRVHPVLEDTDALAADGIVIPAAADRHVHIGLADPAAVLARGVTAVRDLGWPADSIFPLADLSELPKETREELGFVLADNIHKVLDAALNGTAFARPQPATERQAAKAAR